MLELLEFIPIPILSVGVKNQPFLIDFYASVLHILTAETIFWPLSCRGDGGVRGTFWGWVPGVT